MTTTEPIRHSQCFIGGQWTDAVGGETFQTINPATEEVIAEVASGGERDIDRAVQAARAALEDGPWRTMDARERGALLMRLADRIEQESDELAKLETLDNGKPIKDSLSFDVPDVITVLRYYGGLADKIQGETIPINGETLCYTRREPVGVAGQIIPWNYPMSMVAWKWGPALAAGCTIVMKPAEQTPLTCLRMAQLAKEAGFPDGVINVVPGLGPTAGAALVEHPGVDKIAFTGEGTTAKIIMANASKTLKRLTFELGGKSPNIIFADADLDAAVAGAAAGVFSNQGQSCSAGSRVFVHHAIRDQFIEKLSALVSKTVVGDPFDERTDQGPQIDRAQFDKIMGYIDRGRSEGATCAAGGERVGNRGYFIQPTVFNDVSDDMAIAREEIFGPVMSVLGFDDDAEVLRRANDTPYGLAAAVWTRDLSRGHRMAHELKAGTVWINCYDVVNAATPFGGYKASGQGRELGIQGVQAYLEHKTVTVALGETVSK